MEEIINKYLCKTTQTYLLSLLADKGLGIKYKKSLDTDDTMYARYKSIRIDFPEGDIPLFIFSFCDYLDEESLEAFKDCIEPIFELLETNVSSFYLIRLKKENEILREGISSFSVNRIDTIKYPKLKCALKPEKIYLHNERWGDGKKT